MIYTLSGHMHGGFLNWDMPTDAFLYLYSMFVKDKRDEEFAKRTRGLENQQKGLGNNGLKFSPRR